MPVELKPNEIRVLGVLIEKSLGPSDYYPTTLNSLTTACNQKNNRDPVTSLSEGDVGAALHELQNWRLASLADPIKGSRANRFRHTLENRFDWNAAQRAVMCELMIRGPQTLGELRTHAGRLTHIEAIDYVRDILRELEQADPPLVTELPRRPGQSTTRFCQLLGGNLADLEAAERAAPALSASAPIPNPPPLHAASPQNTDRISSLESRLATLEARIDALTHSLAALRDRLGET